MKTTLLSLAFVLFTGGAMATLAQHPDSCVQKFDSVAECVTTNPMNPSVEITGNSVQLKF